MNELVALYYSDSGSGSGLYITAVNKDYYAAAWYVSKAGVQYAVNIVGTCN